MSSNGNPTEVDAVNLDSLSFYPPTNQSTTITYNPPNYTSYLAPVYKEVRRHKNLPVCQPSVVSGLDYLSPNQATRQVTTGLQYRHMSMKFTVVSSDRVQQQRRSSDVGSTSEQYNGYPGKSGVESQLESGAVSGLGDFSSNVIQTSENRIAEDPQRRTVSPANRAVWNPRPHQEKQNTYLR